MILLTARVKQAERMMTRATADNKNIEVFFADGCKGIVPLRDIPELKDPPSLSAIELPNPYQVKLQGPTGELAELPWDFVRHYCDPSFREREENIAADGRQSLGTRIRAARESAKMTQAELAQAAGIGRITELRIENGEQSPRYGTLAAIAQALKLPMANLIEGGSLS